MEKGGTFRAKILEQYTSFSVQEKKIAKYIADHYTQILTLSGKEVAQLSGVSEAAVVRFAKKMGFSGFRQLKNTLKEETGMFRSPYTAAKIFSKEVGNAAIPQYYEMILQDIHQLADKTDMEVLDRVAQKIQQAKTVFLVGFGSDRVVVEYLTNYLPLLGVRTVSVDRQGISAKEAFLQICEEDYILMSAYPNIQEDEKWICKYAADHSVELFLITDSDLTAEELHVKEYVVTRNSIETYYHSYVLSMLFCDLLLMKVQSANLARSEQALKKYDCLIRS